MKTASGDDDDDVTPALDARLVFVSPKAVAVEILASPITSTEDFERVSKAFYLHHHPSTPATVKWKCQGYESAVRKFDTLMQRLHGDEHWSFYRVVMPYIRAWALNYDSHCRPLPLLPCLERSELTRRTVDIDAPELRFLLANCLFCNIATVSPGVVVGYDECGSLSLTKLLLPNSSLSVERTICFLAYFAQECASPSSAARKVQFTRAIYNSSLEGKPIGTLGVAHTPDARVTDVGPRGGADCTEWRACSTPVVSDSHAVVVHVGRMEDNPRGNSLNFGTGPPEDGSYPPNAYFVDFANALLHIGQIIPSMTQEEVLFSCCPEAFVGILLVERLSAREAMMIRGLQRYCEYSGYLHTFKFEDFFPDPALRHTDVLVVDAVVGNRWTEAEILRDLNKVYLSYALALERPDGSCFEPGTAVVSTGHWGCGAFGGNKTLKFLEQLMAAACASVCLDYSTFSESDTQRAFDMLLDELRAARCTVSELYTILCGYVERPSSESRVQFEHWVLEAIKTLGRSKK